MSETDRNSLIEHKLDTMLRAQSSLAESISELHAEHRGLQLQVAQLPMTMLEKGEKRFAPLSRFSLLERAVYGFLALVITAMVGAGIKVAWEVKAQTAVQEDRSK